MDDWMIGNGFLFEGNLKLRMIRKAGKIGILGGSV
jgi:hypothetical protein